MDVYCIYLCNSVYIYMYMYLYMYLYMYMYYMYTHIFASISIRLSRSLYNYDKYVCIYDNMERRQFMVTL